MNANLLRIQYRSDAFGVWSVAILLKHMLFDMKVCFYGQDQLLFEHQKNRQFKAEFVDGSDLVWYALNATNAAIEYWGMDFDINLSDYKRMDYSQEYNDPFFWDAWCYYVRV